MIKFLRQHIFNHFPTLFRTISIISIIAVSVSCSTNKQKNANTIIQNFVSEQNIDRRETVFDVRAEEINGKLVINGETDNPELKSEIMMELQEINPEDGIVLLPDSSVGNKTFGLINLSVANLRTKPDHAAELATQAWLGTPVKILKKNDGWFRVQTPDRYISWVDEDGIFPVSEAELNHWKNSDRIIFTNDNELAYKTENFEYPVSDVIMGNIVEKTGENKNHFKIKLPDGRTGYVMKKNWIDFNQFKNSIKPDTSVIRTIALNLTGRPYLWGGTSDRAMDCSGFVKVVYFMNGIILARDASLQTKYGELIEPGQQFNRFQTGDLLFFGRSATETQPEKVTHVALSLGGTEYIHASGRIKRNSFNPESNIYSEYRKNSFVRARRVIGNAADIGIVKIKNHPWY